MALTQSDIAQIDRALARSSRQQQNSALSSKKGFLNFLSLSGLTFIANKLWDFTWNAIRDIFDPTKWDWG